MYTSVKDKYLRACPNCGRQTVGPSWHEKDITTMAREASLEKSIVGCSLLPTLEIHSTPVKLLKRLEWTPEAILFKSEPRRAEGDSALAGAHLCLTGILMEPIGTSPSAMPISTRTSRPIYSVRGGIVRTCKSSDPAAAGESAGESWLDAVTVSICAAGRWKAVADDRRPSRA
jgi:hypothetical protein